MLSARYIQRQYNGFICRRCLNTKYNVHLVPRDCKYKLNGKCANCREVRNIVIGFHATGHLKMLAKF